MLASVLSDSMLAGWLAGAARATRGLPPVAPSPVQPPSLAPARQPPSSPPSPPFIAGVPEPEPVVHFPIIEQAVSDLEERRIMTRPEFDQLATDAKTTAFTAARVNTEEALNRLAQAVAANVDEGGTLKDFRAAVDEALGPDFLSPGHVENVFRTNVSQAYSTGLMETLAHPLVADEFPYLAYHAVHDGRVRPDHLALEELGLDDTNVYRRDDPIWERFTPPWDYQCRCAIVPMSVEDAAHAGVREARQWLRDGLPPATPQWVQPPPFNPPPGWNTRTVVRMSVDDEGHEHDRRGRFAPKGKGKSQRKPKRDPAHEARLEQSIRLAYDSLRTAEEAGPIASEKVARYREGIHRLLHVLPPRAIERLHLHLKDYRWYTDSDAVTKAAEKITGKPSPPIAGFWHPKERTIHLAGDEGGRSYAHEIAHAIDGPNRDLTSDPQWQSAFQAERHKLDKRANPKSSPEEWFAELVSLAIGEPKRWEKERRRLPLSDAYLQRTIL